MSWTTTSRDQVPAPTPATPRPARAPQDPDDELTDTREWVYDPDAGTPRPRPRR